MPHPAEILPSRFLALILAIAHALALFALFSVLPLWAAVASVIPLSGSLGYYLLRDAWLRLDNSCAALAPDGEGMAILLRDGTRLPCTVLKESVVTPLLTVLRLRPEGGRRTRAVVIVPDSMDAESYRAWRVWLKWGGPAASSRNADPARVPGDFR